MTRVRAAGVLSASVLVVTLTGCGAGQDAAVRTAAADFRTAVGEQDWPAACDLLAPTTRSELEESAKKPCAGALAEEAVPARGDAADVHVFGTMAEVEYADETVFLTRFGNRWRVLAAACQPQDAEPYDCTIKGG